MRDIELGYALLEAYSVCDTPGGDPVPARAGMLDRIAVQAGVEGDMGARLSDVVASMRNLVALERSSDAVEDMVSRMIADVQALAERDGLSLDLGDETLERVGSPSALHP